MNNSGLIDVQSGKLNMMGQGTHTGTFQVASGATLQFRGSQTLNSGTLQVLGTGTLIVGDVGSTTTVSSNVTVSISPTATVRLDFGSLDLPSNANLSPQTLEVSNGRLTIRGTTAPQNLTMGSGGNIWAERHNNTFSNVSVGGTFTWSGGEIDFVKTFTVTGPTDLPGAGSRVLWGDTFYSGSSTTLNANGGGTWDAGELRVNGRAGIVIKAGTTVTNTTASGNFSILPPDATAAGGSVTIAGTFVKQGANTTTFGRDIRIANSGHMDIRQGAVVVTAPITIAGGGDYTLPAGTTLQAPELDIRGGAFGDKGILRGVGTLTLSSTSNNPGVLAVTAGGRLRAGANGAPGVLTVSGTNSFVNITADATDPPRLVVAAERTGVGAADAGRIDVTGTGVVNINFPGTTRYLDVEVVGTGLRNDETYTLNVMTAGGGFQRNTSTPLLAAGYVFPTTDYRLLHDFVGVKDVKLFLSDSHTLTLQFTPIPEPAAVLGLGFAGLSAGVLLRRVWRLSLPRGPRHLDHQ